MKVPSNIIITSKYTIGNELVDPSTNIYYQGYYYEFNNSFFKGKTFDPNADKLIKKEDENLLLNDPKTRTYSQISGVTSQQLSSPKFTSIPSTSLKGLDLENSIRYFVKKINSNQILIKEVNKETYQKLQIKNDPAYQLLAINEIELVSSNVDLIMPGLKTFLLG